MSALGSLEDGLTFVVLIGGIILEFWTLYELSKWQKVRKEMVPPLQKSLVKADNFLNSCKKELDQSVKQKNMLIGKANNAIGKANEYLDHPPAEHFYEAGMNMLASLGATNMSELSAAQRGHLNMSKQGVEFVGKAMTKELVGVFGGQAVAGGPEGNAGIAQFDLKQILVNYVMQNYVKPQQPQGQGGQGGGPYG